MQSDELYDIVDEADRVVGQATRGECHGNPDLIHRVVHIFLFNHAGELLLQKRSANKDIQPGKWDTSVGGHVDGGERYGEAARRELAEELGVEGAALCHLYDYLWRNEIETERIRVFSLVHDGPFVYQRDEIDAIRFWPVAEIERNLGSGLFTPLFEVGWARYINWARYKESETH